MRGAVRPFGAENRALLLERYFRDAGPITAANAWEHVYRLLLWIDTTTSLAHCYESDKCQPGRPWYARSLAFHAWVSAALGATPETLAENIDWLFREVISQIADQVIAERAATAEKQRRPYRGQGFPEPGADPALEAIVTRGLAPWLPKPPPDDVLRRLTQQIRAYLAQENKRKNLVGEGFEDVVAAILGHLPFAGSLDIRTRPFLHDLPGFHPPPTNEKPKKVDLAIIIAGSGRRILVSSKWSVRADREEQFQSDFEAYARLESGGQDFDYVLVTNEFDAARLRAACERRRQNAFLFTRVVHINPQGHIAAYGDQPRRSAADTRKHIEAGRLIGLSDWLAEVEAASQVSQ